MFGLVSGRGDIQEVILLTSEKCARVTICAMADNQASSLDDEGTEIDFTDPLGVKDPTGDDRDDGGFRVVSILYQQIYNLVGAR